MAATRYVKTEILQASKVMADPLRCPNCQLQDLTIYGHMSYPHTEVWEKGQAIERTTNWDVKENFELSSFDCNHCQVSFLIKSDDEVDLFLKNSELLDMLHATGQQMGQKPC